jgi:hypothetical protein
MSGFSIRYNLGGTASRRSAGLRIMIGIADHP